MNATTDSHGQAVPIPSRKSGPETSAQIAARFDERAPLYDESAMHRGLAAAVADSVNLDNARDVLDVATGTGLVLRALPHDSGSALTGVDISEGMLAVARAALPSARFLSTDAARLPFPDASFDLITCVTALHLLPDASAALIEWRRVLRPSGRIVLATFAIDYPATGQNADHQVGHGTTAIEAHAPFGTREALDEFAATAGMRLAGARKWAYQSSPEGASEHDDVCLIAELAPA